jgi:hypothetical protein
MDHRQAATLLITFNASINTATMALVIDAVCASAKFYRPESRRK